MTERIYAHLMDIQHGWMLQKHALVGLQDASGDCTVRCLRANGAKDSTRTVMRHVNANHLIFVVGRTLEAATTVPGLQYPPVRVQFTLVLVVWLLYILMKCLCRVGLCMFIGHSILYSRWLSIIQALFDLAHKYPTRAQSVDERCSGGCWHGVN
jgi:hypothetical protein